MQNNNPAGWHIGNCTNAEFAGGCETFPLPYPPHIACKCYGEKSGGFFKPCDVTCQGSPNYPACIDKCKAMQGTLVAGDQPGLGGLQKCQPGGAGCPPGQRCGAAGFCEPRPVAPPKGGVGQGHLLDCQQNCGQKYPGVQQIDQYQACMAGCGPQRSLPQPPARGMRSQRRASRRAPAPTGQRMLTARTQTNPGYQENPIWPWVVGGVALAGASLYGATKCAPGIRHQERTTQMIEGVTVDVMRTLEYKGCFQEKPWVAEVSGSMASGGETEAVHYEQSFDEKDDAMEWLYPEESEGEKAANPSATAQAVMARRRNPLARSRWPQEPGMPYISSSGAHIGNPGHPTRKKQPKGISLKKSPGDKVRNWFFLPAKDRKTRMAKYRPETKPAQRSMPAKLSTRRLAN